MRFCSFFVNLQLFHLGEEEEENWGPGLTVSFTGQGEEIGHHLEEQLSTFLYWFWVKPQNKVAAISAPPQPSSQIFQGQSTTLWNRKFKSAVSLSNQGKSHLNITLRQQDRL